MLKKTIEICQNDIIQQIKISCQMPSIIEGIVTRKIIGLLSQEYGILLESHELQEAADNLRLVSNLRTSEATWLWLQKHSLSLDDFEDLVYASTLSTKLAQHLFAEKVEPFFVEQQLDYAQVVMYEVVLDDEDLATELFYALQEGEINFHEMAHEYIQDKELRRSGGYRGLLRRSDLKPEISAAVFAANPPEILQPIVTSKGVHLILVEEFIQPQLDNILRYKILSDLFSVWLKEKREQVEVLSQLNSQSCEPLLTSTKS